MPIYEFYCQDCNTIFNFLSSRINTEKRPACPKCGKKELDRQMSRFAVIGKAKEEDADDPMAGLDESKMEQAFEGLMREAEGMNEEDPRQMAQLMRKFTGKTGISMGEQMEEALSRMESGEDPDQIEQEMGDLLDSDDAFSLDGLKKKLRTGARSPIHDETLYQL
ncbi:zinc ribbon domain-containing protein [Desulfobulbus sp. US1]|nr:zinc ribbon domain-containing protein [Desulfobulbus sp. US4]MCW5204533.1 zinc ribbon domain-containing protein [Desulfobulbus sp. N2]MCW5208950.1 zinc ribbon domain-containing protein [Desulfobulbus sp. US1]WLE97795.1 MAG: zinc ribbon domain-containing protein [Candidatus Electrothrix communis]